MHANTLRCLAYCAVAAVVLGWAAVYTARARARSTAVASSIARLGHAQEHVHQATGSTHPPAGTRTAAAAAIAASAPCHPRQCLSSHTDKGETLLECCQYKDLLVDSNAGPPEHRGARERNLWPHYGPYFGPRVLVYGACAKNGTVDTVAPTIRPSEVRIDVHLRSAPLPARSCDEILDGQTYFFWIQYPTNPFHIIQDALTYIYSTVDNHTRLAGEGAAANDATIYIGFIREDQRLVPFDRNMWALGDLFQTITSRPIRSIANISGRLCVRQAVLGHYRRKKISETDAAARLLPALGFGPATAHINQGAGAAPARPRLLLVTRLPINPLTGFKQNGRMFLNEAEMVAALKTRLPEWDVVTDALEKYPRLRNQVAVVRAADIAVMAHGGACMMGLFMRPHAVLVELTLCEHFAGVYQLTRPRGAYITRNLAKGNSTLVRRFPGDKLTCRMNVRVDIGELMGDIGRAVGAYQRRTKKLPG